jgi:hypothetical protein
MTSRFAVQRYLNGKPTGNFHAGLDQRSPAGTPVHAMDGGIVKIVREWNLHGRTVGIDHGQGLESIYLYMSKLAVTEGATVKKGEVIGYGASSGRLTIRVLSERRTGPHLGWRGTRQLRQRLGRTPRFPQRFSRTLMRRTRPCPVPIGSLIRWLDIDLPEYGFGIAVLNVMAAGSSKSHPTNVEKVRFWDAVLQAAESRLQEPFLFVGDWNTGAHRQDETGKTFVCAEHFGRLSTMGWTDTWRHHNPGATEYTWFSKLKGGVRGNGFRVDHAFATPSLDAAHHVLPVLARGAGGRDLGSLGRDCGDCVGACGWLVTHRASCASSCIGIDAPDAQKRNR